MEFMQMVCLVIIARLALSVSGQRQHVVGGDRGWSVSHGNNPDFFQEWANGSEPFVVNDTIDFGIQSSEEDQVLLVNWDTEANCNSVPEPQEQPVYVDKSNAHIVYTIAEPGKLAFISSNRINCLQHSMKFTLTAMQPPMSPPWPPMSPPWPPPRHDHKSGSFTPAWIIVTALAAAVLFMFIAALLFIGFRTRRRYWHRLEKPVTSDRKVVGMSYATDSKSQSSRHFSQTKEHFVDVEWPSGPQRFSYRELKNATKNFSNSQVLGEGGFGTVYKGFLPLDSRGSGPVAVKRLSQYARQGAREFLAEVNIISQLRHRNLVQLLGWCDENDELILVYEYMPNGDLDDLIFGSCYHGAAQEWTPLPWKTRYSIFCGVATALVYLHEEWEQRVVHRDVKTSNVMLDSQFNARLGDFGLARLSAHSQAPRTTLVAGTIGYLAPEFNLTGKAMDKTDVYAFGVVILEVSCARRPLMTNCILVDWVWELHKEENLLDAIDPNLDVKSPSDEEEMKRALQLGLLCCHPDPDTRPTMRHALNILTGETPLPKIPRSKPVAHFEDEYE